MSFPDKIATLRWCRRRCVGRMARRPGRKASGAPWPMRPTPITPPVSSRRATGLSNRAHGSERTAIITGAARGIGAATAMALAARGIAPALFVRDTSAATDIGDRIRERGVACRVEACDVADYGSVRAAVARTADAWGRLDVVVNNAGQIEPMGVIADTDPADWAHAFAVNVIGAYHGVREALPLLLREGGAVVNLSTGAAHTPRDGWSAYCGSQAPPAPFSRTVA